MTNDTQTKVVINACFGGFSLSDEAVREYLRRTAREWTEETSTFGSASMVHFTVVGDEKWYERDIDRADPVLVALVEEWGARANGDHANLEVETLPAGTRYRIHEYDGFESIETRDGIEWSVA